MRAKKTARKPQKAEQKQQNAVAIPQWDPTLYASEDEQRAAFEKRDARHREIEARCKTEAAALARTAQAASRAMSQWSKLEGFFGLKDWSGVCALADLEYEAGAFLLERMGAERFLDPKLYVTLLALRNGLLREGDQDAFDVPKPDSIALKGTDQTSTAEKMLADMVVLAYYHTLRINGWIGNLALHVEHEFFEREAPGVNGATVGSETGIRLNVEDAIKRIRDELLPLMERANRMMLRNLKALRECRGRSVPKVAVAQAEQVNIAEKQVNVAQGPAAPCDAGIREKGPICPEC